MRPPPLRLKIDNRYPIRPEQNKTKSFFAVLYRANWKNAVLVVSGINVLRFTLSALNAYHDITVDNSLLFPHLAGVSSSLCSMYLITSLIDIVGMLSVAMQRVIFIRIYAYLAILSAFVVTIAGAVAALTFYLFRDDVIQECIALAVTGNLTNKSIFKGRPWPLAQHSMNHKDATRVCQAAWVNEGPSQIVSVFLFSLLPSIIYCLLVYTYHNQVTDPTHVAYLNENHPASAIRMEEWPSHSPMYNSTSRPSAPKGQSKKRAPKPSGLMKSSSPMEYMLTPGPPSFGPPRVQTYEPDIRAVESSSGVGYWVDTKRNR